MNTSRQSTLVPEEALRSVKPFVVGVGAVGRNVAVQLAAIGTDNITICDFDTVEDHNVTTQGYLNRDIGRLKVDALRDSLFEINPQIICTAINDRYRPNHMRNNDVVFLCPDKIEVRETVYRTCKKVRAIFDARCMGETIKVLSVTDELSHTHYATTFFTASEAHQGSCTAKMTIYVANIAAGLLLCQFSKWLRGILPESELTLSLLSMELEVE